MYYIFQEENDEPWDEAFLTWAEAREAIVDYFDRMIAEGNGDHWVEHDSNAATFVLLEEDETELEVLFITREG